MSKQPSSGNAVIDRLGQTNDRLTGRAGLTLFSRYLRGVGILPQLGRVFGSVRKNGKGLPVAERRPITLPQVEMAAGISKR